MLEIIARIDKLGPISDDRKQKIELIEVSSMIGDFCLGEHRKIVFLDVKEAQKFDLIFRE